jgi:cytochrome c2
MGSLLYRCHNQTTSVQGDTIMNIRQFLRQLLCEHSSLSSEWAEYRKGGLRINEKLFEQCDNCHKVLVNKPDRLKEIEELERNEVKP